jgi:hypothetical protein
MSFIIVSMEHKLLKLRKALYSLHQAPHARNAKLDDTMLSLGFWRIMSKHVIYVKWNGDA